MLAPSPTLHVPKSREDWLALRRRFVGASDIAALVGVHPWKTVFDLWLEKTGRLDGDEVDAPQLERGRLLEPIAVRKLRQARPDWTVEPNEIGAGGSIILDESTRIAATPDTFVIDPEEGRGTVQIKSVEPHAYRRQWANGGALPFHVAIQANVEADLAGVPWAAAGALVIEHGVTFGLFAVPLEPGLRNELVDRVGDFWRLVETDTEPPVDYDRDGDMLKRYAPVEVRGLVLDFSADEEFCEAAMRYREIGRQISPLKKEQERLGHMLRHKMGDAEVGRAEGIRVTLKTQRQPPREAMSYRCLRIGSGRHHEEDDDE